MISPAEWLTFGRQRVAAVLREAAAAVETLAECIDVPDTGRRTAPRLEVAKTRERIAATLVRARSRYDTATVRPRGRR